MNNIITKSSQAQELESVGAQIDELVVNGIGDAVGFVRALSMARTVSQLRQLMTPQVMEPIMELMGSPLGFKTDRDSSDKKPPYSLHQVRECAISAMLKGVQPTGNQFNIIAGRDYITKEGFTYLLKNVPGLSYRIDFGLAVMHKNRQGEDDGAIVRPKITWKLGKAQEQVKELELAIRVNKGMGYDAIIGKAERKAKAWLYVEVSGNEYTDADADDVPTEMRDVTAKRGVKPSTPEEVSKATEGNPYIDAEVLEQQDEMPF